MQVTVHFLRAVCLNVKQDKEDEVLFWWRSLCQYSQLCKKCSCNSATEMSKKEYKNHIVHETFLNFLQQSFQNWFTKRITLAPLLHIAQCEELRDLRKESWRVSDEEKGANQHQSVNYGFLQRSQHVKASHQSVAIVLPSNKLRHSWHYDDLLIPVVWKCQNKKKLEIIEIRRIRRFCQKNCSST